MLKKLATWYLDKRKVSVMIGFKIKNGKVQSLNDDTYYYSNELQDVEIRESDNKVFNIPEGKFKITRKSQ